MRTSYKEWMELKEAQMDAHQEIGRAKAPAMKQRYSDAWDDVDDSEPEDTLRQGYQPHDPSPWGDNTVDDYGVDPNNDMGTDYMHNEAFRKYFPQIQYAFKKEAFSPVAEALSAGNITVEQFLQAIALEMSHSGVRI